MPDDHQPVLSAQRQKIANSGPCDVGAQPCTAYLISALLRCIPPWFAWRLGGGLGALVGGLRLRETTRCAEHLAKAFPERDAAWMARTTRGAFCHFGRMALWTAVTLHWDVRRLRRQVAIG